MQYLPLAAVLWRRGLGPTVRSLYTHQMAEAEAKPEEAAPSAPKASKLPTLIALLNTVGVLAALGMFIYTRILFKRPQIIESVEREKLIAEAATVKTNPAAKPGFVSYGPLQVNIKATPIETGNGTQLDPGKIHYATVAFTLEIRDEDQKDALKDLEPRMLDQILGLMGRKTMEDLTTVQGRFVLRSQVLDIVNGLLNESTHRKDIFATNCFFTQFMVQ